MRELLSRRRALRALVMIALLTLMSSPLEASVASLASARDGTVPLIENAVPLVDDLTGWTKVATGNGAITLSPTPVDGIGPGSFVLVETFQATFGCTANFLWKSGAKVYLGTAGHCLASNVLNVQVCVARCGFDVMRVLGEFVTLGAIALRVDNGVGNDFALVEVPAAAHHLLRAKIPVWGGPSDAAQAHAPATGCMFGNGTTFDRTPAGAGRPRTGVVNSLDSGAGWRAAMAVAPGDSGAAVVVCEPVPGANLVSSQPIGITTHSALLDGIPLPIAAGTTVSRAIELAGNAGLTLELLTEVPGTQGGAPNAQDDTATTKINRAVKIAVLNNDSDPDGDPLAVSSVTSPTSGTTKVNANNTITYTPARNFVGQDSFTYSVRDPGGLEDTASVVVEVKSR